MQSNLLKKFNGKFGLMALLALTPILPIGLSGCPCACTQAGPFTPYIPLSIAIADLNSDGASDLAVGTFRYFEGRAGADNIVSVVLQNRNSPGSFQQGIDISSLTVPRTLAAANIDGASGVDVITAGVEYGAGNVVALLQSSSPQSPLLPATVLSGIVSAVDLAVGDVNGDGAADLVIAGESNNGSLAVILQNPAIAGQFFAPAYLPTGQRLTAVAIGDLNGDGRVDLAATTSDNTHRSGKIALFFASATSGQFLPRVDIALDSGPADLAISDLNGDGRPDLLVTDELASRIALLLQSATQAGSFATPNLYPVGGSPKAIAVGDVNGDGRNDVVTANFSSLGISVLLQSPTTAGSLLPSVNHALSGIPYGVAIGNLNGDSYPDLAIALGNRATLMFNSSVAPGSFGPPVQVGQ